MLIFFLNHIATVIQLPVVIAGIASNLTKEIAAQQPELTGSVRPGAQLRGTSLSRMDASGAIRTPGSGYLQVIRTRIVG